MNRLPLVCVCLAATGLFVAGCGSAEEVNAQGAAVNEPQEALPVAAVPVEAVVVPQTVEVVGTLEADARTTIASEVGGRVVEVAADLGDRLGPGEPLARIDPTNYRLAVDQREAALGEALAELGLTELPGDEFDVTQVATVDRARLQAANAEAKLRRATSLFEQTPPLISEQEYADLQTAAEVAQRDYDVALLQAQSLLATARTRARELEIAQQNLKDTTVRTPAGATDSTGDPANYAVARRHVTVGQLVAQGNPMFELVVDDPLRFRGAVPERFVSEISLGQRVSLDVAGAGAPVVGTVSRIDPTVDTASRTFLIEVTVDNPDRRLRPGSFARASVVVGERPAFQVPPAALYSFAGTNKVFLAQDGQASERPVVVLNRTFEALVVTGDLQAGQPVIVENVSRLSDGDPITITETPATQPAE